MQVGVKLTAIPAQESPHPLAPDECRRLEDPCSLSCGSRPEGLQGEVPAHQGGLAQGPGCWKKPRTTAALLLAQLLVTEALLSTRLLAEAAVPQGMVGGFATPSPLPGPAAAAKRAWPRPLVCLLVKPLLFLFT